MSKSSELRRRTIGELEAVRERLSAVVNDLSRTISRLSDGVSGPSRAYDVDPLEPEVVAERFGVVDHDDGEVPEWVRDRFGHLFGDQLDGGDRDW